MEWFSQQVIDICRSDKRVKSAVTVLNRCLEQSVAEAIQLCATFEGLEPWTELPISAIGKALKSDEHLILSADAALNLASRTPEDKGLEATAMEMNYFVQDLHSQRRFAEYSREICLEESRHCLPSELPDDD